MPTHRFVGEIDRAAIREHRRALGLTQAEAAAQADIGYSYWRAIENGQRTPSLETLRRIARVLARDPGDLLS